MYFRARLKRTLARYGLLGMVRYLWVTVGFFLPYLIGRLTGGKYLTRHYWAYRELGLKYDNPRWFWTEWGKIYIYDKTRTRLGREHDFFVSKVLELRPRKVLEVGCGFGRNLKLIAGVHNAEELVGVDFSPTMLQQAKAYLGDISAALIQADVSTGLPFGDSRFDLVFTHGLLMHIRPQDIDRVLHEMLRVTKRYIISKEVLDWDAPGLDSIEMRRGRYSYDYARRYREVGLTVRLNQRIGHQVVVAVKEQNSDGEELK